MPRTSRCEKSARFWFHTASDQKHAESSAMLISQFHLLAETRYQLVKTSEVFIVPPSGHLLYYWATAAIINSSRVNLPHDQVIGYQTRTCLKDPFPISCQICAFTCQLLSGCSGDGVVPESSQKPAKADTAEPSPWNKAASSTTRASWPLWPLPRCASELWLITESENKEKDLCLCAF